MKKIYGIIYIIFILFIIMSFNNIYCTYAADTSSLKQMYNVATNNPLASAGGIILGIIRWLGTGILIGVVILKGIKYVSTSPEGKAKIKDEIIMITIGAVLLFATTTIIDIIYDIINKSGIA